MNPTNKGLMAAPVVRATPVIRAAAERSSARTTAIVIGLKELRHCRGEIVQAKPWAGPDI